MSGRELRAVKHCLVIDLEASTDDGTAEERAVPRDEMETIEIGVVLVRALEVVGERLESVRCSVREERSV